MKTYYSGNSMSAIVGRHKVTRAAVSKRCVELTERLDLLPNRAMRSLTARKAYRDAQPDGICKKLRMGFTSRDEPKHQATSGITGKGCGTDAEREK